MKSLNFLYPICKVMEHILTKLWKICQFDFRSTHSCESQLQAVTARALNNKLQVDVGILDLSKAFDKVPYRRLLPKIESYGITGEFRLAINTFSYVIYIRIGPKTEPCGTSEMASQGEENELFTMTC